MSDLTSTEPSRRQLVFATIRQWLAVAALAAEGARQVAWHVDVYRSPYPYHFDPAPIFYLAGAVALALRVFWARYLAICFMSAIIAISFFWWPYPLPTIAGGLALIALLSGRTMRARFEGRAGRRNHWAAELDRRVARLRMLFVAQSIVMGLLFAPRLWLSPGVLPLVLAAGLALAGLVFQRTWAVLAIAPVIALEACLAARTIGVPMHVWNPPQWTLTAVLFIGCGVSLAVIFPMLQAFAQKVRRAE
jgi:hypothetical protein